jgi:hypothetical protein
MKQKGRDVTLFCLRALARCWAPSSPIWLEARSSVLSVCVKQKEWEIRRKVWMLHCFVGEHWQYVVLLVDRSDCQAAAVWWVSMKQREWKMKQKGRDVTLFCLRALSRCCAPSSPIWFQPRFSVVSVYVKQKAWEIGWKGRDVTLFCWRTVARCCAPSSPIWL